MKNFLIQLRHGKPSFFISFTRSQIASLTATLVDFSTLVFLVEVLRIWYVAATALGALAGAITNFLLGRHWSFQQTSGNWYWQAFRYSVVSASSLFLNCFGVYVFTDYFRLYYPVSKIIVAFLIGIFFNFPLHRAYVFR